MRCRQLVVAWRRRALHCHSNKIVNLTFFLFFSFLHVSAASFSQPGNIEKNNLEIRQEKSIEQQKIVISGTVSDKDGPIPGANVAIKGESQGTFTDVNGRYSIAVSGEDAILQFSFIGYAVQETVVGNRKTINILMVEDSRLLDEVVVVGYGVQKKESAAGAISQITGDDMLKMSNSTNIPNALAGQIPGVTIVQYSGQPGADVGQIFIRGVSSWQGNDPLVLVDGVERKFNNIDPNEIETLSVLKDASATAVFGVRGANGVILITTKRGTKGEVKVTASAEMIGKQPINIQKPVNSYRTALIMNEAYKNDNSWGSLLSPEIIEHYRVQDMPYIYPDTDWQELMLKDMAYSHKYNVNISGGTDFARVFASLSYLYDDNILKAEKQPDYDPNWKFNRYNYRFNIDMDLTKSTLLSLDAGGFISVINSPYDTNNQRLFRNILMLGPMAAPAGYPAEVLEQYPDLTRPDETGFRIASTGIHNADNPMIANNYSGQRSSKRTNVDATIRLQQKLDFITKGLSAGFQVAYTHNMIYSREWSYDAITWTLNTDETWSRYKGRGGAIDGEQAASPVNYIGESVAEDPFRSWYFEGKINYARTFGKHEVTGLILGQRRKSQTDVQFPHFEEGIVARITYDYANRYALDANLGYNGSEQFAPENRYGLFPSVGVVWNLHNEKFFEPVKPVISRAKIRASYGKVGSDASPNRWLYTSSYVNQMSAYANDKYWPGVVADHNYTAPIIEENAANSEATWEIATKQNIAAELSFLKNSMFVLTLDFYKEHRTNILLSRLSVPAWFGVGMKQQNLGETKTKGYEIELKYQQTISSFYYWLKPSVSFSDNRIVARDEPLYEPSYQKETGHRIFQEFGYPSVGWVQDGDELMTTARYGSGLVGLGDTKYIDFSGDGIIDENDRVPIGYSTRYPLYNYTLNGGFKYRNLEFDFLFQGVSHYSRVVIDAFASPLHRLANQAFEFQMDAWSPTNPNAEYPAYHFDANRTHNIMGTAARTANTYDASYIRLKSVNLSYSLPKAWVERTLKLNSLSFSLQGNNIFTWAPNYPLTDPEGGDPANGRLNNGYYPMMRTISLGMQVTF
ncbi:MAG: TonB-dependent receptor [Tannerella sp.]|jgi:TonB-linked SusC/RagA family outer membrane protein|nr:TonB-dependent receptor [Tannerella sp.]